MTAWFQYCGPDRSGQDIEDKINEAHLDEVRTVLHPFIEQEAEKLEDLGGTGRVMLVGSSQGGSTALDVALTLPAGSAAREYLGGVAMMRSLALGATAGAASAPEGTLVPVLAVSGDKDDTFLLSLVRRQLRAIDGVAFVSHDIVHGLDHDTDYDPRETAPTLKFISEMLQLESLGIGAGGMGLATLTRAVGPSYGKRWSELDEAAHKLAQQLGVNGAEAWDKKAAPVFCLRWAKLSIKQRQAAKQLGYHRRNWNAIF